MRISECLYHYRFRVDRVIDGDTIVGRLDKGRKNYDYDIHIRLLDINAPEKRGKTRVEGILSKQYLEELILGKEVVVKTHKNKDDDNFGRMLGEIYLPGESEDLYVNQHMFESGYAARYV